MGGFRALGATLAVGGIADVGAKVVDNWWTLFRSPDIDAIVKQAIADSPNLGQAAAILAQTREQTRAFAGGLLPQV